MIFFSIFPAGEPLQFPGKPINSADIDVIDLNSEDNFSTENDITENDPNKLWCICRKPHNNRFMIACDTCQGNLLRGYCQLVRCSLICSLGLLDGNQQFQQRFFFIST